MPAGPSWPGREASVKPQYAGAGEASAPGLIWVKTRGKSVLQPRHNSTSLPDVHQVAPSEAGGSCGDELVCPLTRVQPGTTCRIRQVLASPELTQRLREMGFCEEQKVRLLSRERTMICQVCNVRMGISAKLAESILVEPIASAPPAK